MESDALYLKLDIYGNSYVNLNDLAEFRGRYPSHVSPYVYIPSYIEQLRE